MKKMKDRPHVARGGKGNGRESPVDFMRVSMDKNEENEKSSSDCKRMKQEWMESPVDLMRVSMDKNEGNENVSS